MKIYKPTPLNNLSWKQAKARFPLMKPLGDVDKDGVKNKFDCKPFDFKRQGKKHKYYKDYDEDKAISFEHIKSLKTIGDVQKLAEEY